MDALHQTPLLDLFRRGEAAADVRMLAARGVLAPRAHEQMALLVWLARDPDAAIQEAALSTIDRIPADPLARYLAGVDVPPDVRQFFEGRGVTVQADPVSEPSIEPLVTGHDAPVAAMSSDVSPAVTDNLDEHGARQSTVQRLSKMSITDRLKVAMRGNREERTILIRDANKLVSIAVLSSPRLTEQEVESYAKMASVSEDVLRVIGTSRAWIKDYPVVRALAFNPKTPIAVSMGLVNRLVERDVKALSSDRNIAEPVKLLARKMTQATQTRRS